MALERAPQDTNSPPLFSFECSPGRKQAKQHRSAWRNPAWRSMHAGNWQPQLLFAADCLAPRSYLPVDYVWHEALISIHQKYNIYKG